jgi:hypothetical protein
MKLWLDDRRRAPEGWTRCFTVAEAQHHLRTGLVEEASLDHDLGACDVCMAGMSTETADAATAIRMFRTYKEAERWLSTGDDGTQK